ncbi:MAG: hypothetical protein AAF310_04345 [Myxococcota bacterium]
MTDTNTKALFDGLLISRNKEIMQHQVALQQIKNNNYAAEFADHNCSFVLAIGGLFYRQTAGNSS